MVKNTFRILAATATCAVAVFAQGQRQATIVGGGNPNSGKCTIEVVVDDVAQVEVRGTTATLRTLQGQPAQWRRFECTAPMPANMANFRFAGVDGRGSQQLIRDPRNGGVAVVQIEDKDGGAEGYTFDLFWDSRATGMVPNQQPDYRDRDQRDQRGYDRPPDGDRDRDRYDGHYRPDYRDSDYYHRYGHPFSVDEAVRVCQQAVVDQARSRFRTDDIHFHRTNVDDRPGRQDWVVGSLDIHRGPREERFGFSCSVNFNNGRVRSAELDTRPMGDDPRWH